LAPADVAALVELQAIRPLLGVFGEPRVNVLALNLALDGKTPHTR
jgi:K+-transporting ATPase ATPase C chain